MTTLHGIGLGFRIDMAADFLAQLPSDVKFVEVHPENYAKRGGLYRRNLHEVRDRSPLLTHGLTMCFGHTDPFDREFLAELKSFLREVDAPWHSDHLCFGGADGAFVHDLLPLPFHEEAVQTVSDRIRQAQDALDVEIAFENVSYYAPQGEDGLDEARFCVEVLERTGAKIMLDVNNVFVNSRNFGFDPRSWIDMIPPERVVQMHVAGHLVRPDGLRIDTHGESVCDEVYDLLEYTLRRTGPKPVLLERDNNVPPLQELIDEVQRLSVVYARATSTAHTAVPSVADRSAGS